MASSIRPGGADSTFRQLVRRDGLRIGESVAIGSTKRGEHHQRLDVGRLGDQAIPHLIRFPFEPLLGEPQKIFDDRFARDFRPGHEKCKGAHPGAPAVLVGIAIHDWLTIAHGDPLPIEDAADFHNRMWQFETLARDVLRSALETEPNGTIKDSRLSRLAPSTYAPPDRHRSEPCGSSRRSSLPSTRVTSPSPQRARAYG